MYILANMWFTKLIKQFFFWLDKIVYNFISEIYDLLITIARTSVLTQADIADMADRVYKLLAIFMVFKVTLSLITYVVNPDDFTDKSKGVSKLGANIVISLAMLILTPYIFSYAFQLQTIVLEDNSLATLVFGDSNSEEGSFFNSAGDDMAYITMSAFLTPNLSLGELHECSILIDHDTKKFNETCKDNLESYTIINGNSSKINSNFEPTTLNNYVAGVENQSLGLMFRQDLVLATDEKNENFIMDYKFVFSTVVGVVIILLLITFCMDVALRSIKLSFLQLIAPIPIISYVDPKSGKDGLFKKWYEMCFKTYLSLFIRLIALYFAVYIISKVADLKMVDIVDGSYQTNALVAIFIIVGALMFAKQLPKLLEGLGIKLDGDGKFLLNPLKKFEEQAIGGKKILGAGKGLAAGTMIGTAGMLTGAGLGRGVSAAFGGLKSGIEGKKFNDIRKDQATKNAEMRRAIASGSTFAGRMGARVSGYFGTPGRLGDIEHDKLVSQNRIDDLKAETKVIKDKIKPKQTVIANQQQVKSSVDKMESFTTGLIEGGKAGKYSKTYKQLATDFDYLTNNIGSKADHEILNADGTSILKVGDEITGSHAQLLKGETERYSKKVGRKILMDELLQGKSKENGGEVSVEDLGNFQAQWRSYDADVQELNESIEIYEETKEAGDMIIEKVEVKKTFTDMHTQAGELDTASIDVKTSIKKQEGSIKDLERQIESEEVKIQEYNAEEKIAKSDVEATHSTQGGPSNPSDIIPPTSTVGRRVGGPGSGYGGPRTGNGGHGGPYGY